MPGKKQKDIQKEYQVSFSPQENIICIQSWGGSTEKKAREMKNKTLDFSKKIPPSQTVKLLVEVKRYTRVTASARRAYFDLAKEIKKRKVKIALVTSSVGIEVIAKFLSLGINIESFRQKEKALEWLRAQGK